MVQSSVQSYWRRRIQLHYLNHNAVCGCLHLWSGHLVHWSCVSRSGVGIFLRWCMCQRQDVAFINTNFIYVCMTILLIGYFFSGQYGIPRPWYFPLTSLYWCGTPAGVDVDPDPLDALEQQNGTYTHILYTHRIILKYTVCIIYMLCWGWVGEWISHYKLPLMVNECVNMDGSPIQRICPKDRLQMLLTRIKQSLKRWLN